MFIVYVLQSEINGRYYIGCTKDVDQRLAQHNAGISKATKGFRPWRLVHTEAYPTLARATKREARLKSWKSRVFLKKVLGLPS